ncbi:hypothetical protein BaRGS_00036020 [Batillaria attramentaria]|uniref:Transmembrane protein 144 n=1 Tax=Batillaria attramentaria TaxID=370345 RepID=A0ABD0JCU4_9CAEN
MERSSILVVFMALAAMQIVSSEVLSATPVSEWLDTTTTNSSNSSDTGYPTYVGFITAGVAVITFGSNFIPVKQFDTGDGMFFQWMMCCGVFLPGIIIQMWRQSEFYPLVMLGGTIWTTGNICVVPIIKTIGMGLGLCIWGMFNLLSGWASGRFGWFGLIPEVPKNTTLNYIGVALAVASSVIYVFVKNEVSTADAEMVINVDEEDDPLIDRRSSSANSNPGRTPAPDHSFINNFTPSQKKIVGVTLSIFSGLLYGSSFAPAIHCQDNYYKASQNSLDYVFAHYCGIFLTSSVYFFIYAIFKKNNPAVYPKVILPAVVSGAMWGVATACWFVANKALSEPVSFPIVTTGPGAIASLFWGVVVFGEIKGRRNILILLLAFAVTAGGVALAAISHG